MRYFARRRRGLEPESRDSWRRRFVAGAWRCRRRGPGRSGRRGGRRRAGTLDVDLVARSKQAEVGLIEGFRNDIVSEGLSIDLSDGETDAIDRGGFAKLVVGPRRGEDEAAAPRVVGHGEGSGSFLDDSGEHFAASCEGSVVNCQSNCRVRNMARNISGMVTVITGASAGIGAALARELARRGARLILAARRIERLEALNRELGGGHLCVECNVADVEQCRMLVERAVSWAGRLDTVVCNAGYGCCKPVAARRRRRCGRSSRPTCWGRRT